MIRNITEIENKKLKKYGKPKIDNLGKLIEKTQGKNTTGSDGPGSSKCKAHPDPAKSDC